MNNNPNIWFPAKRYGWGWGLPVTWQGWAVMAVYTGVLIGLGWRLMPAQPASFALGIGIATALFSFVCWWRGETPRWRWGDRE
jgi:hypothetical protein